MPRRAASSRSRALRRRLATTPPPPPTISTRWSSTAFIVFWTSTSTIASWIEAAASSREGRVPGCPRLLQCGDYGRLEAREGEVVTAVGQRPRKPDPVGVSRLGESVDGRSARKAQSHKAGQLVECFACGVVDGLTEDAIVSPSVDQNHLAVASRGQQHHARRPEVVKVQAGREQVSLHVVHAEERKAATPRHGLGWRTRSPPGANRPGPAPWWRLYRPASRGVSRLPLTPGG